MLAHFLVCTIIPKSILYILKIKHQLKMKRILILSLLALIITSCGKEEVIEKGAGSIDIEFDNVAVINNIQNQLSLVTPGSTNYNYTNGLGQPFNLNLLRYYISGIKLEGPNGASFTDEIKVDVAASKGIYLIDESKLAANIITLENVPAGEYNKISFTVGVDTLGVKEGASGGVLDPATCKMFWNWNSGYIAVKIEGQSPVSNGGVGGTETLNSSSVNGIAYHKSLSFNFDTNAKVEKGLEPHVHMILDVISLFKGQNMIDFTGNHNVHKPIDGKPLADNIPNAFSFDHLHQ